METGGAKESEAHRTQAGSPRCLVQSGGGGSRDEADGDHEVFRAGSRFLLTRRDLLEIKAGCESLGRGESSRGEY